MSTLHRVWSKSCRLACPQSHSCTMYIRKCLENYRIMSSKLFFLRLGNGKKNVIICLWTHNSKKVLISKFISDLSELFNSDMAGPTMLIAGVLFVDILLMVFYFGERTNKSYRYRTKKRRHYNYGRNRNYRNYGHQHYYHVGRMGDLDADYDTNESQRLEMHMQYQNN